MCVKHFMIFGENASNFANFQVEGVSYLPEGKINGLSEFIQGNQELPNNLTYFSQCMSQCNESKILFDNAPIAVGLPTEAALKVLVEKIGHYDPKHSDKLDSKNMKDLEQYNNILKAQYSRLALLEFTRDRKAMSVICTNEETKKGIMFIKGAPDYLVKNANKIMNKDGNIVDFNSEEKTEVLREVTRMASQGLRCLALAVKFDINDVYTFDGASYTLNKVLEDPENYTQFEKEPIILGFVAMQDPPRPSVKNAIETCRRAGISVMVKFLRLTKL